MSVEVILSFVKSDTIGRVSDFGRINNSEFERETRVNKHPKYIYPRLNTIARIVRSGCLVHRSGDHLCMSVSNYPNVVRQFNSYVVEELQ